MTSQVELGLPPFLYGGVYYRRTNPPEADWERDYKQAAADGWTVFRHWVLWSSIEVAPGRYDWSNYDRQLDLAAKYGLKTIMQEKITSAPIWAWEKLPEARLMHRDGRYEEPNMSGSCAAGGFPGLNLNHPEARELAGNFLMRLAERYGDHPGLGAYDIVNEAKFPQNQSGRPADYDFSLPTIALFQRWLETKYGTVETLAEAWGQFGYTAWEQIRPPRKNAFFAANLDWLAFRVDNTIDNMAWRAQTIRAIDPKTPITSHGQAQTLETMSTAASEDWRAARTVDIYGFTYVQSRHGNEAWKQFHAVDLVRAASRDKTFWHAEHLGGPVWLREFLHRRPREDGRIREPEDIRLSNLISMAGGARGIMYPRMRPLLNGPLFNTLGPYGLDGRPTDRSAMTAEMARWVKAMNPTGLWDAKPVRGDLGIIVVPEAQHFAYALHGDPQYYTRSVRGAYRGWFEAGFQPDWVALADLDQYRTLHLPFPVMLERATIARVRGWVEAGGKLIADGLPGYFMDGGKADPAANRALLEELFGAAEIWIEFLPDLLEDLHCRFSDARVRGGVYLQAYAAAGGDILGHYDESAGAYAAGRGAIVAHAYGRGRTLLTGTFPGYGHYPGKSAPAFFEAAAAWAGLRPALATEAPGVTARLSEGAEQFLWLVNANRHEIDLSLPIDCLEVTLLRHSANITDGRLSARVPGRDAVVLKMGAFPHQPPKPSTNS